MTGSTSHGHVCISDAILTYPLSCSLLVFQPRSLPPPPLYYPDQAPFSSSTSPCPVAAFQENSKLPIQIKNLKPACLLDLCLDDVDHQDPRPPFHACLPQLNLPASFQLSGIAKILTKKGGGGGGGMVVKGLQSLMTDRGGEKKRKR